VKLSLFSEKEIQDIQTEVEIHNELLNSVAGLITFTLALACLGFENPQKVAMMCSIVIIALLYQASRYFPPTLKVLRELEEDTKDTDVMKARKALEGKYYGWRSLLTKAVLFWYGLGFYLAVLLFPEFTTWLKT